MKSKLEVNSFLSKSQVGLLFILALVVGAITLPTVVTQAQQATLTPTPVFLPGFLETSGEGIISIYASSRQQRCAGVITASPSDKVWQVWPSTEVIELGNGSQSATIEIWQCSGYYSKAAEAQAVKFLLLVHSNGRYIPIAQTPAPPPTELDDNPTYTADAVYKFSPDSQAGLYTLFIGNETVGWLRHEFKIRTGPVIGLQDSITDWPKTEFRQGEIMYINYKWFSPASPLEIGLYKINGRNPLLSRWEIMADQNGNYRGELFIPNDIQPGTYQLAACNLRGSSCEPVLSEPFDIVAKNADVSLPYSPEVELPDEIK